MVLKFIIYLQIYTAFKANYSDFPGSFYNYDYLQNKTSLPLAFSIKLQKNSARIYCKITKILILHTPKPKAKSAAGGDHIKNQDSWQCFRLISRNCFNVCFWVPLDAEKNFKVVTWEAFTQSLMRLTITSRHPHFDLTIDNK